MLINNYGTNVELKEFLEILIKNDYKLDQNIQYGCYCWKQKKHKCIDIDTRYKLVSWNSSTYAYSSSFSFPEDKDKILQKLNIKQNNVKQENQNMNNYSYTITDKSVTIFDKNKPYIAKSDHPNFKKIVSSVLKQDFSKAIGLFDIQKTIEYKTDGKIQVINGQVYYQNTVVHNSVCSRILEFLRDGKDINHLVKFLEKLLNNPSKYVFNNLYEYLSKYNLSIDKDGDIYAIKAVKHNLKSKWTDQVQYVIGETYSEPRALLRDDQNNSYCGRGLWFGHEQFVFDYGSNDDHVIVVKVNPSDVIAIPSLSNYQKMAACAITPILDLGEISQVKHTFNFKSNSIYDSVYNGQAIVNKVPKRDKFGRFTK